MREARTDLFDGSRASRAGRLAIGFAMLLAVAYGRIVRAPCDDAYIFYVYAKNFVQGNGLTYNGTAVQGFTSVVWTALLALAGLTRVPLPILGEVLSGASACFALWATYRLGRRIGLDRFRAAAPAFLLALTGDFAFYSAVGLEECLFAGLVALTVSEALFAKGGRGRGPLPVAILMAATIGTRPEGGLVAALLFAWMTARDRSAGRALRTGAILAAIVFPAALALRLAYGSWLPNTYYVKSNAGLANFGEGVDYLLRALPRYAPLVATLALAGSLRIIRRSAPREKGAALLFVLAAAWLVYVAAQGGDNLVGGRVLVPALPLLYVGLAALAPAARPRPVLAVAALAAALLVAAYARDDRVQRLAGVWRKNHAILEAAALRLRDEFPPGTKVALNAAGIIPFYSGLPAIDMLGLNDRHIARSGRRDRGLRFGHQAGDGAYVLAEKPGVILLGGTPSDRPGLYVSDQEIWASSEFHERYDRVDWEGIGTIWVRRQGVDGEEAGG